MTNGEIIETAAKATGDLISLGVVLGTLASYLPAIAAVFSIIWTGIRIFETKTVQKLVRGSAESPPE